ncbi:unnamed protein product [Phytophthora fragariaefolia]|uniref:Unnamed protein product n=1 Tax=Phytophthora fragariaefolia TaxID=1490495 RepID=A0A9W6U259_9STRA|nr:unnamed protein product [Phytophthora fragariaefolia]
MSTRRSSSGSRRFMRRLIFTVPPPRVIGAVENVLSRLEEGASSSSESDTSVSSRGSRRTKTSCRSRRQLKPRRDANQSPDPTESVCTIAARVINSIELSDTSSRPKSAEPKSAREERFATQSWEALKASGNPVYETAREFTDVFPDKIPAVLPADRGVHHEIDLAPGAKKTPRGLGVPSIKKSLASAPILMLPDDSKPFHGVCDASDFAIGCALMQFDDEGPERVVSYQSRQMKPAERNYPVHDKELFAMRYALIKFRVYLLGEQTFAVYTDHASLRTAMKSPHLSQCMVRWLSFFADDDHCAVCTASDINLTSVSPEMDLRDEIAAAYADDAVYANILAYLRSPSDETLGALSRNTRNQIDRYHLDDDLLCYNIDRFDTSRVVVPNDDDLRARIIHEVHDSPMGAHLGREKTFTTVSRDFYGPRMYK